MVKEGINRDDDGLIFSATRKSPRVCVRKVKENSSQNQSISVKRKMLKAKGKSEESDNDPDYSEEEDVEGVICANKKVPGYRCSPHLVPELFQKLSTKQKEWVKKIEFDSLEGMIDSRMTKSLTMWLVDRVDTATGTLEVCGRPISIREGIVRLLKLPSGKIRVPPPLNGRSKAKRAKGDTSRPDLKYSDNGRGQTAKDAMKSLLAEENDEEEFCRSFVMLLLCIYLAPTTSLNINRSYYSSLMDVSSICLMDWCAFIADYLIQGIDEYRRSKASHVQVPGCVHVLPLLYLDALVEMKALKLPESLTLPEGEPRVHFIGTQHLDYLASADVKSRSKDHVQYGKLQVSVNNSPSENPNFKPRISKDFVDISESVPGDNSNKAADKGNEAGVGNIITSLFDQIKQSRNILIEEFKLKMETSDLKILSEFQRKLYQQFPITEERLSSQENIEGSTSQQTIVPDIIPSSDIAADTKVKCHSNGTPVIHSDVLPNYMQSIRNGGHSNDSVKTPPAKKLRTDESVPSIEHNDGLFRSINPDDGEGIFGQNNLPVGEMHPEGAEIVSGKGTTHVNVEEHTRAGSLCFPGDKGNSDICYEDLDDVVKIGIEAAFEANSFQRVDSNKKTDTMPLTFLAEAASSHSQAIFDKSPVPTIFTESPVTPSFGAKSVTPVFIETSVSSDKSELKMCVDRPALFDKSPSTPSFRSIVSPSKISCLHTIHECSGPKPVENNNTAGGGREMKEQGCLDVGQNVESIASMEFQSLEISQLTKTPTQEQSVSCEHSNSDDSESDEDCEADVRDIQDDDSGDVELDFVSNTDFIPTPSYTYDTQEIIEIPDTPGSPPPNDILEIPPLQGEIENGCSFRYGCSVSTATGKLYTRFIKLEPNPTTITEPSSINLVLCKEASDTYKINVLNSSVRISTRFRKIINSDRQRTKIQIKRFHITKGEFVDALKPNGEVCRNFMGLCSVAIQCDWGSDRSVILDQASIVELMKEGHECDQKLIAGRLRKLHIDDVDNIYLPILTDDHWILAVVDIVEKIVIFYDSLLKVRPGENPHKKMWDNLAGNLEESYCLARSRSIHITYFRCSFGDNALQTNTHDCGFHVIQTMECHKLGDVLGYSKKKTMMPYRKYLSHVLIYHRFNDLNPLRVGLREEVP